MRFSATAGIFLFFLLSLPLLPVFGETADRDRHLDRLFQRTSGWIGGDGVSSIPLPGNRIFWAFGDSWIGRVFNGSRQKAQMINNAIALQNYGPRRLTAPSFHWTRKKNGESESFFTPPDHRGWFWPLHGVVTSRGLFVFLLQLEKTADDSVFGFKNTASTLVRIPNFRDSPDRWTLIYRKLPWSYFSGSRGIFWGSSVTTFENNLYVFGIDERPALPGSPKKLVLARTPLNDPEAFQAWQFWDGTTWNRNFRKAATLMNDVATEFSVTPEAGGKSFRLITMEKDLSRRILSSTAPRPEGPWTPLEPLYIINEERSLKNAFCYAAKAHPELAEKPGELVISFVVNSFDFWEIVRNARLYWPRFIRIEP